MLVFAHEMFFDIERSVRKVADVTPLAIGDGTNGISGPFRIIVVHTKGVVAVIRGFSQEDTCETVAIKSFGVRFAPREVKNRRENVCVLHNRVGAA